MSISIGWIRIIRLFPALRFLTKNHWSWWQLCVLVGVNMILLVSSVYVTVRNRTYDLQVYYIVCLSLCFTFFCKVYLCCIYRYVLPAHPLTWGVPISLLMPPRPHLPPSAVYLHPHHEGSRKTRISVSNPYVIIPSLSRVHLTFLLISISVI